MTRMSSESGDFPSAFDTGTGVAPSTGRHGFPESPFVAFSTLPFEPFVAFSTLPSEPFVAFSALPFEPFDNRSLTNDLRLSKFSIAALTSDSNEISNLENVTRQGQKIRGLTNERQGSTKKQKKNLLSQLAWFRRGRNCRSNFPMTRLHRWQIDRNAVQVTGRWFRAGDLFKYRSMGSECE